MLKLRVHKEFSKVVPFAAIWDDMRQREPRQVASFSDIKSLMDDSAVNYRFVVAEDNARVVAMACFFRRRLRKSYSVGERRLFSLPIKEIALFGSTILGEPDDGVATLIVKVMIKEWKGGVLRFHDIIVDSSLYRAVRNLKFPMIPITEERKDSFHWLINLPVSFEQYLSSLGTKTRKSTTRSIRKFEEEFRHEFIVVSRPEQVDDFLRGGESISRSTYQWHIGQRLNNDEATRRRYAALAKAGQLRCHLLKIDGEPAAFARGQLDAKFFYYDTPGFLPKYEKLSPGTIVFTWVVRDLIENTNCTLFDFGVGHADYKARFGNVSLKCTSIDVVSVYSPYSVFLVVLQKILSFAKNGVDTLIGDSVLRQRIKKAIRKTGGG